MIDNPTSDATTNILDREPESEEFTPEECEREYWRVFGNNFEIELDPEV